MDLTAFLPLAKFIGIVCPTIYAGFTASDSLTFVSPIVLHAPNQKIMAKQWLAGYQYGPLWVPPLVMPGTIANLLLAYACRHDSVLRNVYVAAAVAIFSILPITFLYMEPGINGACKWKVQLLLREEGFSMHETAWWFPSAHRQGGTLASRRWAERTDMRELILFWRGTNNYRAVIAMVAVGLSGWGSLR
ncbi:hypothetical protein LTR62_000106 [Meristemomyces frigidus]|uniref:Uncharacterized protein n=1 Tax=Meristemomyces frigidus TaxID=1508187 RepID=A0AAN7TK25_9PEZI|nr:hypothetical protein LTR62_000106 [Meristemomyces frigidus]